MGTISGPISGGAHGWPFAGHFGDIGQRGYLEEEFFLAGTARRYDPVGAHGGDGKWAVEAAGEAPYKTRILIKRPKDPAKFNGTVVVEWANVTLGHELIIADFPGIYDGFAHVSVSAQFVGLHGFEENPMGLVSWDSQVRFSVPSWRLIFIRYFHPGGTRRRTRSGPRRRSDGRS